MHTQIQPKDRETVWYVWQALRRIIDSELSLRKLLEYVEMPQSFASYVSVELNLSKYVDVKEKFR